MESVFNSTPRRGGATNKSPLQAPAVKTHRIVLTVGVLLVAMSLLPMILVEHFKVKDIMKLRSRRQQIAVSAVSASAAAGAAVVVGSPESPRHDPVQKKKKKEAEKEPSAKVAADTGSSNKQQNNNNKQNINNHNSPKNYSTRVTADGRVIADLKLKDLQPDDASFIQKPVARGVSGRPLDQTPAVKTARRAHIECDLNVDSLAYWNDDDHDYEFQPQPFLAYSPTNGTAEHPNNANVTEKFLTFTPDRGGWNNIRMSMEVIFVIAAVTNRTLVLPPKEHMYLLHMDNSSLYRGFGDFFPLSRLAKRVKVISFIDFLNSTASPPVPADLKDKIHLAAEHCERRGKGVVDNCTYVYSYLKRTGASVHVSHRDTCLVFDEEAYENNGRPPSSNKTRAWVAEQCGTKRKVVYWNAAEFNPPTFMFFDAGEPATRLLAHFYNTLHFTSPRLSHYYKRFVRDYLHYHDLIYCAAGKIVKAVQAEAALIYNSSSTYMNYSSTEAAMLRPDSEGAGGFSALHVRRGDLQYEMVKISAQEWYNSTKQFWVPRELLYIATDERNKSWFDPIAKHHELRFLDDYWDLAGLEGMDPNYMGMIDTIVASRGRAFAGTYYSTFSGYINRLRGYHGLSMKFSWYSWKNQRAAPHFWRVVNDTKWEEEYPDGWIGIDADEWPSRDKF